MDIDNEPNERPRRWRQRLRAAWQRSIAPLRRLFGPKPEAPGQEPTGSDVAAREAPAARLYEAPFAVPPEHAPVGAPAQDLAPPRVPVGPPLARVAPPLAPVATPQTEPEFIAGTTVHPAGTRPWRLFLPGTASDALRPLLVMLHGCRQNPEDFAAGTRMNELAQAHGIVVLYPGQSASVNRLGCWNWFHTENQQRDSGEPAIIADLTREIIVSHRIDPHRVYIAGLSAGGAMSAILAATYPDLYAAVGIHSGLPHAAAHNLPSALAAMRHGPLERVPRAEREPVPTIVFHGDEDTTVHPDNGDEVIAQARWGREAEADAANGAGMSVERGAVPGGRSYTRTVHRDAGGRSDAEHWLVHASGHAWSGGSAIGSYTDPLGPDASVQMLRFFIEHPRRD
jgi:poly(hydroxyalkanoate) depolymerase family esterase